MFENKILIVDNFYEDPDSVRSFALKQNFTSNYNDNGAKIPGVRTDEIQTLSLKYFNLLKSTLFNNLFGYPKHFVSIDEMMLSRYQVCLESDGDSWPHYDKKTVAGLVYLTPNPPPNSGTIFYDVDPNDPSNKENITVKQVVQNVYNRAIIYSGTVLHKSENYFGDTLENGRLINPFFIDIMNIDIQRDNS
jgi:hypothetical protein